MKLLWLVVFLIVPTSHGEIAPKKTPYQNRALFIEQALLATMNTPSKVLTDIAQYIRSVDSNICNTNLIQLRVQCLHEAAKKNCLQTERRYQQYCGLYSDVIITNRIEEKSFLNRSQRYKLLKKSDGSVDILNSALRRRYAAITVSFMPSVMKKCKKKQPHCIAKEIDSYCADFSNKSNLSWQGCSSALVWFIGYHWKETL